MPLNDLNQMFSIVDPNTGKPTDYLMRLLRDRGVQADNIEETVEALQTLVTALQTSVDNIDGTVFSAGTGLSGGGTLGTDDPIAFVLDALLGNLTDVDTTTTPPTDGQALVWVDADSLWKPGTVSGGGGGGGGGGASIEEIASWDHSVDGTVSGVDIDAATLGNFDQIWVMGRFSTSASGDICIRASDDDLTTIYDTGGDYQRVNESNGTDEGASSVLAFSGSLVSGTKSFAFRVVKAGDQMFGFNDLIAKSSNETRRLAVVDASTIDSFRVYPTNGTNLTGGSFKVYRVRYGASGGGGGGGGAFSGAKVYASADFSQGSGTNLITDFDTVDFEAGSWWNTSGYFEIPSGVEYIEATLYVAGSASTSGQLIPTIQHRDSSGSLLGTIIQMDVESAGGDFGVISTGPFQVSAGDRIYPATFLTNSRTLDGGTYGCYFTIKDVTSNGGGGGGGSSSATFAEVRFSSNTSVGSGSRFDFAFDNVVSDPGGWWDSTTKRFTVPSDGVYMVDFLLSATSNRINVVGVADPPGGFNAGVFSNDIANQRRGHCSGFLNLSAGDTIGTAAFLNGSATIESSLSYWRVYGPL